MLQIIFFYKTHIKLQYTLLWVTPDKLHVKSTATIRSKSELFFLALSVNTEIAKIFVHRSRQLSRLRERDSYFGLATKSMPVERYAMRAGRLNPKVHSSPLHTCRSLTAAQSTAIKATGPIMKTTVLVAVTSGQLQWNNGNDRNNDNIRASMSICGKGVHLLQECTGARSISDNNR